MTRRRRVALAWTAFVLGWFGVAPMAVAAPVADTSDAPASLELRAETRQAILTTSAKEVASAERTALATARLQALESAAAEIATESGRLLEIQRQIEIARQAEVTRRAERANLLQPTAGQLGSGFGLRLHPILGVVRLHNGVDIGAPCGRPVYAAAGGVVIFAGTEADAGNFLRIDHGTVDGVWFYTTYLHLSKFTVGLGDTVARGQEVGRVGSTGLSSGCHLHFSTVENEVPVDPERYLRP